MANRIINFCILSVGVFLATVTGLRAQTATGVRGLYFTGVDDNGTKLTVNSTKPSFDGGAYNNFTEAQKAEWAAWNADSHWNVTYVSPNMPDANNPMAKYLGAAKVITPPDSRYLSNNANWIIAPATSSNVLPGSGTGANMGRYVYTLAFQVLGTGTGTVSNLSMALTIAADDQWKIWVNPAGNGTSLPTTTPAASDLYSASNLPWTASGAKTVTLNSGFKIGPNYLVIEVDNTWSNVDGGASLWNPSGLNVTMESPSITIGGVIVPITGGSAVVPEAGTWLPVAGALGFFVWWRRRRDALAG